MRFGDAPVFPGFLTPVLTQLFFPKPLTTFLTCFCRGERQKYARKRSHLNRGSNSQPPSHESDTLTTEPSRQGDLPFPKQQILDGCKLKKLADDNFKFDENCRNFSKSEENTVRKGEIARYEQSLLSQKCFQKICIASKKRQGLFRKGLTPLYTIIIFFDNL